MRGLTEYAGIAIELSVAFAVFQEANASQDLENGLLRLLWDRLAKIGDNKVHLFHRKDVSPFCQTTLVVSATLNRVDCCA